MGFRVEGLGVRGQGLGLGFGVWGGGGEGGERRVAEVMSTCKVNIVLESESSACCIAVAL